MPLTSHKIIIIWNIDETLAKIERKLSYLSTKSDKLGPDFTINKNVPVIAFLDWGKINFKQLATFYLTDRTALTCYKRKMKDIVYSDIGEIKNYKLDADKTVNLSRKIKVLDYSFQLPDDFHIDIGIYEESLNLRLLVKDRPNYYRNNISGVRIY